MNEHVSQKIIFPVTQNLMEEMYFLEKQTKEKQLEFVQVINEVPEGGRNVVCEMFPKLLTGLHIFELKHTEFIKKTSKEIQTSTAFPGHVIQ